MERRAFLRGVGAAGGLAVGAPAWAGAAGRHLALDRLLQLQAEVIARAGGHGAEDAELTLGPGASARRSTGTGGLVLHAAPVAGRPDAIDLFATLRNARGAAGPSLALALRFGAWTRDNYVLMPGACYAGNRFESRFGGYPPLLTEPADIGPHVPPIVSDIPRLNLHPGPSHIELLATDLATPAVAVFFPREKVGLIWLADPAAAFGRTGIGVLESDDRTTATLGVRTPFAPPPRGRAADDGGSSLPSPAGERARGELTLRARAFVFSCPTVGALYERLFSVRKDLTGPSARVHVLPFSAAFAAHETRVNQRWVEAPGFFAAGSRSSAYSTWQTGWCGGLATTLPLLAAGDKGSRARALRTIAFLLDGGQAPSGFFHGVSDGSVWYDDGFTAPLAPATSAWPPRSAPCAAARRWHLVRRSAETLTALLKQLALLERQPGDKTAPIDPAWSKAARRCAEALANLWERHKQLGQFVDIDSGEIVVGGSTSAGLAPAALALAAAHFATPRYLDVAKAAAAYLHDRYVRAGLTCGGPGDALQCPDSESAMAVLESLVTLYEATQDRTWIDRAREAAHLLASWVVSFDAPTGAKAHATPDAARATGAVLTDAQSRTGAPGYVLSSGDALFRLYRATGEIAWLELLRDTVHSLAQYLPRSDPEEKPASPTTRASAHAATNDWLSSSAGVVPTDGVLDAIGLLSYTEVPGIYAQVDSAFVFAFDHVEARVKERLAGRLLVSIRNPTASPATVRLFAETAADAAQPLGPGAVLAAPTALVPPRSTVEVTMPPMTVAP